MSRSGPYDRDGHNQSSQQQFETPANSLKVSANTDVRELANTITAACQMGEIPALLTIGQQSINQAVKGIAAAASELKTVGDLTFQPAFRHENRTKPLIAFYLSRGRFNSRIDNGEEVELTATANQKIVSLAGAIAGKVRAGRPVESLLHHHDQRASAGQLPFLYFAD
jgi:stage V sporulation protein SpoVS